MRRVFLYITLILCCVACSSTSDISKQKFVTVCDGQFFIGDKPYYYIGTNFWFGGILGSDSIGGDQQRVVRELDFMKSKGINNLRILVGADGRESRISKVEPALQLAPGVYNQSLFKGLDFLLNEMGKRGMYAVLYLNNSWEWSGGYSQYLEWSGCGTAPIPAVDGWNKFLDYVAQYAKNEQANKLFLDHVRNVVSRTNTVSGTPYKDDPTIMAWQIGNEPRPFGEDNKEAFAKWIAESAALIKSIDNNHLVSIGSEGSAGCEGDIELWKRLHDDPNVDYSTIHIWPNNWGWLDKDDMKGTISGSIYKTMEYIETHEIIARELHIPMVLEEFGLPRDGVGFGSEITTTCRDTYYSAVFDKIVLAAKHRGAFAGCNFWAWGGYGRPSPGEDLFWQVGDDYVGDPAQEEQGLNSVYDTDTTVSIIEQYTLKIDSACSRGVIDEE